MCTYKHFLALILILASSVLPSTAQDQKDFVKGADVGFLLSQERRGTVFHDSLGNERECLELLKNDYQMSAIRMRVWVNPMGGWNDKNELLAMAKRVKALGMDFMVDFHYSDSWADPGKQPIPKAWENHSFEEMKQDLRNHTIEVLTLLKFFTHVQQHSSRPQGPKPPMCPASWRAPICFISMRTWKASANTFMSWRKSTRPSAM